jgi:hypothetical protein
MSSGFGGMVEMPPEPGEFVIDDQASLRVGRDSEATASHAGGPGFESLELAGRESELEAAEERIAASLDRLAREIRSVKLARQALFAFVDSLVKTLLTCIAERPSEARDQAVAQGKFRYERFLKSVGAAMAGDSKAAMAELLNHSEKG